jgi:hypothetical protein
MKIKIGLIIRCAVLVIACVLAICLGFSIYFKQHGWLCVLGLAIIAAGVIFLYPTLSVIAEETDDPIIIMVRDNPLLILVRYVVVISLSIGLYTQLIHA